MSTFTTRRAMKLVPVLALLAWLATTSIVSAQDRRATLDISAVETVQAGSATEVVATLIELDGAPIEGELIEFYMSVKFLSNSDDIAIGTAVTDEKGTARIEFVPKAEGEHFLTASTSADSEVSAFSEMEMTVSPGPQLYRELSPVRVPGANVWMAAAVLLAVWGVFVMIALRIWQIAKLGEDAGGSADA